METRPFIRDVNDPHLVIKLLEGALTTWADELTRLAEESDTLQPGTLTAIRHQILQLLRDIRDRRLRLEGEVIADRRSALRSDIPRGGS